MKVWTTESLSVVHTVQIKHNTDYALMLRKNRNSINLNLKTTLIKKDATNIDDTKNY